MNGDYYTRSLSAVHLLNPSTSINVTFAPIPSLVVMPTIHSGTVSKEQKCELYF